MEYKDHFTNLPMSVLETMLKSCFIQRPDIQDHILSSDELTDYIAWMARTFGRSAHLSASALPVRPSNSRMSAIADRLLANPTDDLAIAQLATSYGKQSEEAFFRDDHDISVARIMRYMPAHWHTNLYFEIYYAFSGECSIHFPDEVIRLKPGSVMIVAPTAPHASPCYDDQDVLIYYMLRATTFDQVFWNQLPTNSLMASFFKQALSGQHPSSYLLFETGADPEIRRLMTRIHDEYYLDEPYKSQLLNALMSTLFILLLRRYEGTAKLPRRKDIYWKHEYSAILSHIQTHYAEVTLPELAARFHYSEKQISRIVQGCLGVSYNRLILKLRMEKAAGLLRQQNASVERIAAMVGYSSVSSFYRAFTRYYGCTPGSYHEKE